MSRRRKVLIVSHHFYPSRIIGAKRMSELAQYLSEAGMDVSVLCRLTPSAESSERLLERVPGVKIIRIWSPQPILDRIVQRLRKAQTNERIVVPDEPLEDIVESRVTPKGLSRWRSIYRDIEGLIDRHKLWSFLAASLGAVLRLRHRFDLIISSGPPMSSHIAATFISYCHRCAFIVDMRDPWVGIPPLVESATSKWRLKLEARAQSKCFNRASLLVSTTPEIAEFIRNGDWTLSTIESIPNGFDWELEPANSHEKFRLLYAGTLYLNRNPFPLCIALSELLADPNVIRDKVELVFAGNCDSFAGVSVRDWVRVNGLDDIVTFAGQLDTEELEKLTDSCAILINFAQDQGLQIPGKTYEGIGAKRLLLTIAESNSATARLIRELDVGVVVEPGCQEELNDAVRRLYERLIRQRDTFQPDLQKIECYSRRAANLKYLRLIDNVIKDGKSVQADEGRLI
jgi:hypothetical protein